MRADGGRNERICMAPLSDRRRKGRGTLHWLDVARVCSAYTLRVHAEEGRLFGFRFALGYPLAKSAGIFLMGEGVARGKKANARGRSTRQRGWGGGVVVMVVEKMSREKDRDGISKRRKLREFCPKGAFFRRFEKGVRRGVEGDRWRTTDREGGRRRKKKGGR